MRFATSPYALRRCDRVQLTDGLAARPHSRSLSAAGRLLFAESGQRKHSSNDADRHAKYLARPGLDWANLDWANLDWANLAGSALPATADVRGCMVRRVARVFGNLQARP
ncbi:MAG: hypothetical protein CMQ61_12285 [Gammaproteobacteria bacterium]|nr:hypothetical protein [Gammaproteobacteria bacterium]